MGQANSSQQTEAYNKFVNQSAAIKAINAFKHYILGQLCQNEHASKQVQMYLHSSLDAYLNLCAKDLHCAAHVSLCVDLPDSKEDWIIKLHSTSREEGIKFTLIDGIITDVDDIK